MRGGVVPSDAGSPEETRGEGGLVLALVGLGNNGIVVGLVVAFRGGIGGGILHAGQGRCRCRANGMGRTLHVHKGTVGDESISSSSPRPRRGGKSRSSKRGCGLAVVDARAKGLTGAGGTSTVVGGSSIALALGGGSSGGGCLHLLALPPRSDAALERRVGIGKGCAEKVLVVDD